jgi:hypothetical protein
LSISAAADRKRHVRLARGENPVEPPDNRPQCFPSRKMIRRIARTIFNPRVMRQKIGERIDARRLFFRTFAFQFPRHAGNR